MPACRTVILPARTAGRRIRTLEQAMLALVIEYSKLLLLFLLIGTVVTLSRFGARQKPTG